MFGHCAPSAPGRSPPERVAVADLDSFPTPSLPLLYSLPRLFSPYFLHANPSPPANSQTECASEHVACFAGVRPGLWKLPAHAPPAPLHRERPALHHCRLGHPRLGPRRCQPCVASNPFILPLSLERSRLTRSRRRSDRARREGARAQHGLLRRLVCRLPRDVRRQGDPGWRARRGAPDGGAGRGGAQEGAVQATHLHSRRHLCVHSLATFSTETSN